MMGVEQLRWFKRSSFKARGARGDIIYIDEEGFCVRCFVQPAGTTTNGETG